MSFQVIAHNPKAGFIVKDFKTVRAGARFAAAVAKRVGKATLVEREPGYKPVPVMTCTLRHPYEGRSYARCVLTAAGEVYLRRRRVVGED